MSQKHLPAHRDYPDAEVSYDGPDADYDTIDADADRGEMVDGDGDDPAPDTFPETLFDDEPVLVPAKGSRGHGDS